MPVWLQPLLIVIGYFVAPITGAVLYSRFNSKLESQKHELNLSLERQKSDLNILLGRRARYDEKEFSDLSELGSKYAVVWDKLVTFSRCVGSLELHSFITENGFQDYMEKHDVARRSYEDAQRMHITANVYLPSALDEQLNQVGFTLLKAINDLFQVLSFTFDEKRSGFQIRYDHQGMADVEGAVEDAGNNLFDVRESIKRYLRDGEEPSSELVPRQP
jgi:hypothetical protein